MTIKNEEINKIKEGVSLKEFKKKVLKKRPWLRGDINVDPIPDYWQNLKDQLTEPLAKELVEELRKLGDEVVEYDERIYQILELLGYTEEFPDFEGKVNATNPDSEKEYWSELRKKLAQSTRDDDSWRNLENLINIVVNTKEHLGLSDTELDNLPTTATLVMPTKKVNGVDTKLTLKELINFYNSFPPSLREEKNLEKLLDEANRYRKLNIADNDEIREGGEIDQAKINRLKNAAKLENELAKIKEQKETGESEKKQLQTELEELKTANFQTKKENENLKNDSKLTQETIFQNFKDSLQELEISVPETKLQIIKSANSVEDIEKFRKEIFAKELTKSKKILKNSRYLNATLVILFVGSLLILTGIVIKQRNLVRRLKVDKNNKKIGKLGRKKNTE
ncbi:MAG: hypothetical protein I3273_00315 [Candidatus Moeniiplasma glomeromycotorum]|nr:hypothetical protein [Candidatus Moeniiplasma glomeromycotorum]MCE8167427.1 hypothetical protein [Candidatus Moeniiplasma glomeromycotorum]MCE8168559.1 hypothetical protein [Candidatus Moeniiplasma glomeromycotorum]